MAKPQGHAPVLPPPASWERAGHWSHAAQRLAVRAWIPQRGGSLGPLWRVSTKGMAYRLWAHRLWAHRLRPWAHRLWGSGLPTASCPLVFQTPQAGFGMGDGAHPDPPTKHHRRPRTGCQMRLRHLVIHKHFFQT